MRQIVLILLKSRAPIDAYLLQNREQALIQQQSIEQQYPPTEGIRARLLARQATQQSGENERIVS